MANEKVSEYDSYVGPVDLTNDLLDLTQFLGGPTYPAGGSRKIPVGDLLNLVDTFYTIDGTLSDPVRNIQGNLGEVFWQRTYMSLNNGGTGRVLNARQNLATDEILGLETTAGDQAYICDQDGNHVYTGNAAWNIALSPSVMQYHNFNGYQKGFYVRCLNGSNGNSIGIDILNQSNLVQPKGLNAVAQGGGGTNVWAVFGKAQSRSTSNKALKTVGVFGEAEYSSQLAYGVQGMVSGDMEGTNTTVAGHFENNATEAGVDPTAVFGYVTNNSENTSPIAGNFIAEAGAFTIGKTMTAIRAEAFDGLVENIAFHSVRGKWQNDDLPAFADDAAAGGGGLTVGQFYQTTGAGAAPQNVAGLVCIKQ